MTSRAPTLRLRPLEFEPDLVRRDLYNLEIEEVTDPALLTLFRAKRDELARELTALEDRDTSRFVYASLQLYGGITPALTATARELLETIPEEGPAGASVTAGAFADAARAEIGELVHGGADADGVAAAAQCCTTSTSSTTNRHLHRGSWRPDSRTWSTATRSRCSLRARLGQVRLSVSR